MKCELCHKADAAAAIIREKGGEEEELYVCEACAKAERQRRQHKSQRTRKVTGLPPGVSMSVTEISAESGDGEPPPIIGAIMGAFENMVSDLEKASKSKAAAKTEKSKMHELSAERVEKAYRIRDGLHLEGLLLIGELEPVKRAMRALDLDLAGISADGINECGHVYRFLYSGSSEQARRVIGDLLREERNARVRLFEEMPRVFGDALCRSLAVLKNCRLLSPGELFDMLSPLRLAALRDMLEGITLKEIETMMAKLDLASSEDNLSVPDRDRADAERADEVNRRFEDVMLKETAEGKFL